MSSFLILVSLVICRLLVLLLAQDENCPEWFDCGSLGRFNFPLTRAERPDCGFLAIHGCDDPTQNTRIQLEENGTSFLLINVAQPDHLITALDQDLYRILHSKPCEVFHHNITLPENSPLLSFDIKYYMTLFRCDQSLNPPVGIFKYTSCPDYHIYYYNSSDPINEEVSSSLSACPILQLPVDEVSHLDKKDIFWFISAQMVLQVQLSDACEECYNLMEGKCRLDSNTKFFCDKSHIQTAGHSSRDSKLGLGVVLVLSGVVILWLLACCIPSKIFLATCSFFWRISYPSHQIIDGFLKQHGPLSIRRYSYSEIKKATDGFKIKLGQGGFGSVYKGKLQDERLVAVKVLSELKGTNEEFINEVASISKTSHVNIVNLLGFCFQGSKRALVYEFMPNGSLEKFVYEEKNADMVNRELDCKTLYDIAIGVARGLEYLHRGCNTRILHLDIKPHNILLDEDFCPKISDFGLAKVCPRKESIVSLVGVRGTAGYIAPEVFLKNFGRVSHKSDVYSYGMMVLEIIGGRSNINVEADCSSELYFPHWIYKRLELNEDLGLKCIKNEIGKEIIRKLTVVSLWCIQTDPSTRPAMSKVVDMLEGSLESLQVPPEPFLSSPPNSAAHYITQTSETAVL